MAKKIEYSTLSDEELIQCFRNSFENSYIGELYTRYMHLVYGVCLKYLKDPTHAEDATMQIFEKLIKDLKKHHIVSFKPWLFTVVKNHCMQFFRKDTIEQKNIQQLKNNTQESVEFFLPAHLSEEDEKEMVLKKMKEGLHELKAEQKLCIEAFYLHNKNYQQIADENKFTLNEVKSFIQNGKRNLKIFISNSANGK